MILKIITEFDGSVSEMAVKVGTPLAGKVFVKEVVLTSKDFADERMIEYLSNEISSHFVLDQGDKYGNQESD